MLCITENSNPNVIDSPQKFTFNKYDQIFFRRFATTAATTMKNPYDEKTTTDHKISHTRSVSICNMTFRCFFFFFFALCVFRQLFDSCRIEKLNEKKKKNYLHNSTHLSLMGFGTFFVVRCMTFAEINRYIQLCFSN